MIHHAKQTMSEFIWKRQELQNTHISQPEKKRHVLVLYTGGTIGSKWTEKGYAPAQDYLEIAVRTFPMLYDKDYEINEEIEVDNMKPLVLPLTIHKYRIVYYIKEYNPLLDSSNMSMSDWAKIAEDIKEYYQQFDSFVILHGTDTMAYTASALSFMLEDLGKTVIITGSQIPLCELRNDGRDNLLVALIIAGEYIIPEVTLYFHNKLFRGNRTVKMNSGRLDAFASPNIPPLATVGVNIDIAWDAVFRPSTTEKFKVHLDMNINVGVLRLFPGISLATVHSFLQPPMDGVVLQTYGAGNMPDLRTDLMNEFTTASERGVIIVNCTQCASGHVTDKYAAGRVLKESGVIPGHDMTPEAALTKLSYLLGKRELTLVQRRKLIEENTRGELTVLETHSRGDFTLKNSELLQSVAKTLRVTSSQEIQLLRGALYPPLMCAACADGSLENIEKLVQEGGDLNRPDYAGLTPLHLAAREGRFEVVEFLLKHGASVHKKDHFNHNPLYAAIKFKHFDVIKLLVQTGACIQEPIAEVGTKLCLAAAENDKESLEAWLLAGVNISTPDYSGNTAIQVAIANKSKDVIKFLEMQAKM